MKTSLGSHRRQRGVSLIEALVSFAVMGLGMLGVMGVQTTLRFNSDVAKQRSEATRLAQEHMEQLRSFSVLETTPGARAYDDIVSVGETPVAGYTMTNTTYTLSTVVQSFTDRKDVTLTVAWNDRQGGPQQVVLNSVISGTDPALSGMLSLPPNGSPQKNPFGRDSGIPIEATELTDGRSAYRPPWSGVVWVFNNTTGLVTQRCTGISGRVLSGCVDIIGRFVSGVVRFDTDGNTDATQAENPTGSPALDLDMALALLPDAGGTPSAECFDDAPAVPSASITSVQYACVVTLSAATQRWSGRLDVSLAGRTLGHDAASFRICRYSADYNQRDGIENLEHPRNYSSVDTSLTNQNFLVVRGDTACPTDANADPNLADFVNSNTVEQAPNPA